MKKLLIAMLVLTFVFATAAIAMASGYKNTIPFAGTGTGIHGGYATGDSKCKTCHAVHEAADNNGGLAGFQGFKLLRTSDDVNRNTKYGACKFCHLGGFVTDKQVYDNVGVQAGEHELGALVIPDSTAPAWGLGLDGELGCDDCHVQAPHGANAAEGGADKLTGYNIGGSDVSVRTFCTRCHDNNGQTGINEKSHYMGVTTGRSIAEGATAAGTTGCKQCHGNTGASIGKFPHESDADLFVDADPNFDPATSKLDTLCLTCHQWGGNGVGLTF